MNAPLVDRMTAASSRQVTDWYLEGCLAEHATFSRINLKSGSQVMGRSSDCDFKVDARNVSKRHAEITVIGDLVFIQDLNSTNGSFINGSRVTTQSPVGVGDLIQIADMEFRLARTARPVAERTWVADRPEEGWLISRLHEVIHDERFHMVYQPIVAANGMQSQAVEALVRCDVPGLNSPVKLFDAAVRLGLEKRISSIFRGAAVESIHPLSDSQVLFLNTHPHELLDAKLVESLQNLRDQAGNRKIVLEIHEAAVPVLESIRKFRDALKDLGIGLAYDDFGAGQSRLLELVEVPPDYLKFDRSLLMNLETASSSHLTLIQSLVAVASQAGVQTIAEGLENLSSVEICKQLGFTHFQGFCLGRPAPIEELIARRQHS